MVRNSGWLLLAMMTLGQSPSSAQIVNVLPQLKTESEGWSGTLGAAIDWRTGNRDLFDLNTDVNVTYRKDQHLVLLILAGELQIRDGDRFLSESFEHLRYRRGKGTVAVEGFLQHGFDRFRRLSLRALAGVGLHFRFRRWESGHFRGGSTYMLELERLREAETSDSGAETVAHRWSNYLAVDQEVGETLKLSSMVFVQPRWDQPDDIRLLNENSLTVRIAKNLSLVNAIVLQYDSKPPETVRSFDTAVQTAVVFQF